MTREKILKLIKGLNRFYPDDLVITSEEDEKTVLKLLDEFLKQGVVKRLDNNLYLYIGYKKQSPKKNTDAVALQEYQVYKRIKNITGKALMTFSKELKKEFPDIKLNYANLVNIKKKFSPKEAKSLRKAIAKPKPRKKTINFATAANKYFDSDNVVNLKKSTLNTYKIYINNHLVPFFKDYTCLQITEKAWQEFCDKKKQEGMQVRTLNKLLLLLKKIAKTYDPDNYPDEAKQTVFKKETHCYMRILSEAETIKLLQKCRETKPDFYPLLFTAISTGLTRGEILGLTWDRVDFENRQIKIDRSLLRGEFEYHKTPYSIRQVDMTEELSEVLKIWKRTSDKNPEGFVFPSSTGTYQDPDNMVKRQFVPLVKAANIKEIRFCDLRDIYASLLIKQGLPLSYIQIQLGHSSVNVTYERYQKLLDNKPKKLVSLLSPSPADTDAYLL